MLIIPITESAAVKMITIDRYTYDYNGALQIVGIITTEVVAIEQPIVAQPVESNDAHWTPIKSEGTAWALTADDNAFVIPGRIVIRVKKLASPGNAFGIRYV